MRPSRRAVGRRPTSRRGPQQTRTVTDNGENLSRDRYRDGTVTDNGGNLSRDRYRDGTVTDNGGNPFRGPVPGAWGSGGSAHGSYATEPPRSWPQANK